MGSDQILTSVVSLNCQCHWCFQRVRNTKTVSLIATCVELLASAAPPFQQRVVARGQRAPIGAARRLTGERLDAELAASRGNSARSLLESWIGSQRSFCARNHLLLAAICTKTQELLFTVTTLQCKNCESLS